MKEKEFKIEFHPNKDFQDSVLVSLINPFTDTHTVYAQVMVSGSGSCWIPKQTIKRTYKEAYKNLIPSSISDSSWGIHEFKF